MPTKTDLRSTILAARAARDQAERDRLRAGIRSAVLSWCDPSGTPGGPAPGDRIAAYQPLRTEPGSVELLAELARRGYEVIVPITRPDRDLDWVRWLPDGQPRPEPLGLEAIGAATLVLVPACAVDRAGNRLGRGGGSYDRALARVGDSCLVAVLIYSDELLAEVPTDPWDRPVAAAFTPDGLIQLTPTGRRNSG